MLKQAVIKVRQRLKSAGKSNKDVFDEIYRSGTWKGPGEISSGLGSTPENARDYEDFIVAYIERHDIRSMVDVGCGDHQVSHRILARIPWTVDYTGLDVSSVAIDHNTAKFANEHVRFRCADAAQEELPAADLVVMREVLQHIPNTDVARILPRLKRFPHALVTNTVAKHATRLNVDIAPGSASRAALGSGLALELPPFGEEVEEMMRTSHKDHPTEIVTVRLFG